MDEVWRSSGAAHSSVWHAAPGEEAGSPQDHDQTTCGARGIRNDSCIEKDDDRRARERYEKTHSHASDTAAPANSADGGWSGGSCFRRFPRGIRLVREARGIAEEKNGTRCRNFVVPAVEERCAIHDVDAGGSRLEAEARCVGGALLLRDSKEWCRMLKRFHPRLYRMYL